MGEGGLAVPLTPVPVAQAPVALGLAALGPDANAAAPVAAGPGLAHAPDATAPGGTAQASGLGLETVADPLAGYGVELAPQLGHAVVAVPQVQPTPRPQPLKVGLAVVGLVARRPAAGLAGEPVVGHRLRLGQQRGVGLHGAGPGSLGGLRQPGRVGERHPAVLQCLPHRGHVFENPSGAGLALRPAPGHAGRVAQHPGTPVAVSLQRGERGGRPCLVGGELGPDRLGRLQVPAKVRGAAVADGDQHPGEGRFGPLSMADVHEQTFPQGYDIDV